MRRPLAISVASALAWLRNANAAPVSTSSDPFDMPLVWTSFGFSTDVLTIGTPAQNAASFVDWSWIGQYIFTPLCNGNLVDTYECLHADQLLFNMTESSTFKNESDIFPPRTWNPNHFFFYDDLSVEFGSDIFKVGPDSSRVTVQAAAMNFEVGFAYPFAGVYGMSPVFKGDNASIQSPFYQMIEDGTYDSPITSFVFCHNSTFGDPQPPKSLCNGRDGLQTLGGFHSSHIGASGIEWHDNVVFPPVNDIDFEYDPPIYNYWGVPIVKHLIGDEEQPINETTGAVAIMDHASYGRGLPMSLGSYKRLIEIAGGKPIELDPEIAPNNGNQSYVTVDCDDVPSLPVVKYQLEGSERTWDSTPEHYVEKVTISEGETVCVLNVRTLGEGDDYIIGNFGETFAKEKVILFDFTEMKVGLADLAY